MNGMYGLLLIPAIPVVLAAAAGMVKRREKAALVRFEAQRARGSRCNVPAPPLEDWQL